MRITAKHPIRKAVEGIGDYHDTMAEAIETIMRVLSENGLTTDIPDFAGEYGHITAILRPDCPGAVLCACCDERLSKEAYDNCIVLSYYRLGSGRWEVITYVS